MNTPLRINFGFNKCVSAKKNGQYMNVYINDNVFEDGKLVKEKSKFLWLKWKEAIALRDAINTLEEKLMCQEVGAIEQHVETANVVGSGISAGGGKSKVCATTSGKRINPY
ncbi:uncharacterized protein LOC128206061 [Mya arenaria]|uniref:uncharacterized protein LOC128206061 n=1 Tax=Mya arenaria TaxID=6604 RepID=UPI0022E7D4D8|nr:uncharacterized protein LOC128206061 [Mya arenaria]